MRIIEFVEFKEWFWEKFEEWRKGTTNGPTAFARFLGLRQQHVSAWLDGNYKPKSQEHISKLASKYPDVYQVLGLIPPDTQYQAFPESWASFPSEVRGPIEEAGRRAIDRIRTIGVDPDSPAGRKIIVEELARAGWELETDSRSDG